jgi:asparagine synthase (glutamine-hydrolysing)
MCGIAGVYGGPAPLRAGDDVVARMCALMVHRGPDDQGLRNGTFAHIGMRRLSIIDVGGGHQPISNEDGTVWVVFNGEIYNYVELRETLRGLGHVFRTDSDTECIVHAYETWGVDCFTHLRGMFGIAIVDERQRRVVLARDRLGKKPLYWTRLPDGRVAFASELKCLLAVPGFDRTLSEESVSAYFTLGYVPTPGSIFRSTRKLSPGHALVLDGREALERPYWSLDTDRTIEGDDTEFVDRLHAELDEAVRIRLRSDVPFGAFLSGGLDSSVVAALMARNLRMPVKTFTIGFKEAAFSEIDDARAIARHIGAEHHELVVEPDAVELLPQLAWHLDEPFADSSSIPTYLVSKLAAGHVKMVLSGDGGDEMFGGYSRYLRYASLRRMADAAGGLGQPLMRLGGTLLPGARGWRLRRIAERAALPFPRDYIAMVALSGRDDLAGMLRPDLVPDDPQGIIADRFPVPRDPSDPLGALCAGDIGSYLLDDVLVKVDRMSMAASIEARAPLLDHRIAEFAAGLPSRVKVRDGRGKWILREVARRLLPAASLDKPKQGFAIPLSQWLRGPLRPMASDLLNSTRFRQRGLFDAAGASRMLDAHLSGAADHGEHLWLLLSFECWAARFLDGDVSDLTDPRRVAATVSDPVT